MLHDGKADKFSQLCLVTIYSIWFPCLPIPVFPKYLTNSLLAATLNQIRFLPPLICPHGPRPPSYRGHLLECLEGGLALL